jgi:hypothetical protein
MMGYPRGPGGWRGADVVAMVDMGSKLLREQKRFPHYTLDARRRFRTDRQQMLFPTSHRVINQAGMERKSFGRQLVADPQVSIGDLVGEDRFDSRIKKWFLQNWHRHIITSYCQKA